LIAISATGPVVVSRTKRTCYRKCGADLLRALPHDEGRAHKAFAAARLEQEQVVQKQKDY